MTQGVIETKHTDIFFAISATEIHKVACATGAQGLGGAADQVDITCLDSEEREYKRGMLNPAQMTIPINFIPRSAAHQALVALKDSGETVPWMLVLSDQAGVPNALDSEGHLVSPGPTTAEFLAYIADFTVDVAINEIVRATLTLQRSGAVVWDFPPADLA